MQSFEYHRPSSLKEAVSLLEGDGGSLLAGGQSLIPAMKHDLAAPAALVSLRDVAELKGIHGEGKGVSIGAMGTHAEVAASAEVQSAIPALAALAGEIGDPQVRHRGTIGGSVAHADPAADYPAALVGLGATVVTDKREIPSDDFFTGMFGTALKKGRSSLRCASRFPTVRRMRSSRARRPSTHWSASWSPRAWPAYESP